MLNFTFGAFLKLQQNFQGFCRRNTPVDLQELREGLKKYRYGNHNMEMIFFV